MSAYLLIAYNIEFDAFYEDEKMEDVVKVVSHMEHQNGEPYQNLVAPYVLAPIAMEGISGVENYTRYCIEGGSVSNGEDAFTEAVGFADSSFFELAEFNMLYGSIESFKDQKSIMLSEKLAKKYFADEDPTDQILILEFRGKKHTQKNVGRGQDGMLELRCLLGPLSNCLFCANAIAAGANVDIRSC